MYIFGALGNYFNFLQRCHNAHYSAAMAVTTVFCAYIYWWVDRGEFYFLGLNIELNERFWDAAVGQILVIIFCLTLNQIFIVKNAPSYIFSYTFFEKFINRVSATDCAVILLSIIYALIVIFNGHYYLIKLEIFVLIAPMILVFYLYCLSLLAGRDKFLAS